MPKTAVALFALAAAAHVALAALSLPVCCQSMTGTPYSGCTCLSDDLTLNNEKITTNQQKNYHWIMTNWSSINVPDNLRPTLTVDVSPCNGSVSLFVMGPTIYSPPFPNPTLPLIKGRSPWNSTLQYSPNSITFTLVAAQYFITVLGTQDATYSISVRFDDSKTPTPGGNGTLAITSPSSNDGPVSATNLQLGINFMTAEAKYGIESTYEYRVYKVPVITDQPCGNPNVTSAPDCILSTPCGLDATSGMIPVSNWTAYPPATNQSVVVSGLLQDQQYTFNVAVRNPATGNIRVYTGTRGTPTYSRVTSAASNTTIIAIASGAGGGFVILVICIVWARTRLTRRMQQYRQTKLMSSIHPKDGSEVKGSRDLSSERTAGRLVRRIATRVQRVVLRRFLK